jgi:hypothetical protein
VILDELVEALGGDRDVLRAAVVAEVGDLPMVVGGSLADDLGHANSDVDVYCFVGEAEPVTPPRSPASSPGLDVHVVPIDILDRGAAFGGDLLARPSAYDGAGIADDLLTVLHALAAGTPLHRADEVAALRLHAQADLVAFHFAAAALDAFSWLAAEASALLGEADGPTGLATLVRAAEAGVDASLGAAGRACPNPKWRFALVAAVAASFPVPVDRVVATLLPGRAGLANPTAAVLSTIRATVTHAVDHPLLRPTAVADRARAALVELRAAVGTSMAPVPTLSTAGTSRSNGA